MEVAGLPKRWYLSIRQHSFTSWKTINLTNCSVTKLCATHYRLGINQSFCTCIPIASGLWTSTCHTNLATALHIHMNYYLMISYFWMNRLIISSKCLLHNPPANNSHPAVSCRLQAIGWPTWLDGWCLVMMLYTVPHKTHHTARTWNFNT
jgi:hypothetical protein